MDVRVAESVWLISMILFCFVFWGLKESFELLGSLLSLTKVSGLETKVPFVDFDGGSGSKQANNGFDKMLNSSSV